MKWIPTDPDPQHWFKVYLMNVDIEDNGDETNDTNTEEDGSERDIFAVEETEVVKQLGGLLSFSLVLKRIIFLISTFCCFYVSTSFMISF